MDNASGRGALCAALLGRIGRASRRYDLSQARAEHPRRGSGSVGVFEVALRDQRAESDGVQGAELTTYETALNDYPNRNGRFMLNDSMTANNAIGDAPDLLSLRAQIAF